MTHLYPPKGESVAGERQLWQALLQQITYDPHLAFVDSFPIPVCRFARAYRCRKLRGLAAFGYDELAKQTFYSLCAHVRVCYDGPPRSRMPAKSSSGGR